MDVVKDGCNVCLAGIVLVSHPEISRGAILYAGIFPTLTADGWSGRFLQALDNCRCGRLNLAWANFYNIAVLDNSSCKEVRDTGVYFDQKKRWEGRIKDVPTFIDDMEDSVRLFKEMEDKHGLSGDSRVCGNAPIDTATTA